VLLCAVLFFFGSPWKWSRRIFGFLAAVLFYLLGKKCLMSALHVKTAVLAMADAHSLQEMIPNAWANLLGNITTLFSAQINHVVFVNAGTLVAVLVFGWKNKRYLPYQLLILLFVAGQFLFCHINEFRTFLDILPLSWILLSEYWRDFEKLRVVSPGGLESGLASERPSATQGEECAAEPGASEDKTSVVGDTTWSFRGGGSGLSVMAELLVVSTTFLVTWRYCVVAYDRNPNYPTRIVEALRTKVAKGSPEAQWALGTRYLNGDGVATNLEDAIALLRKAVESKPDFGEAHNNLGAALLKQGRSAEAIEHFQRAIEIAPVNYAGIFVGPDCAGAHCNLGIVFAEQGRSAEAAGHYREALRLKPDSPDVLNDLAWFLATCRDVRIRDGIQAVKYAEHACELTNYKQTVMVGTLAAAYAEAGRFDEAISTAEKACALASESGDRDLLKRNQELLVLYRAHRPYHEVASPDQAEPPAARPVSGDAEKLVPAAP
jgi:tetratricopeptide (TPR) repeat protein